ncbi:PEP-CTERM sorting domain-containing protein [Rubellimicrobium roseum]|uniref:Ice-binding protein C-terminal domain-containing protein n=1 Tax=Rubellimicrobium roseum TaxID=687525 RepID=A0A5C4NQE1_9RHOB|nr:PEP-CTERM sorting domain-containing protein [Rubellimicrobium roseum]TNC74599.1 hypothetical protein FHG71_00190 [Rubellimicrobium roseum]
MNLFKATVLAAIAAIGLGGMASAATITVDTSFNSGTTYAVIAGSINGFRFTMQGYTLNDDLTNQRVRRVGFDAGGFGVSALTGTGGRDANGNTVTASPFSIDGLGYNRNELLRITFETDVKISGFTFGLVDDNDDFYIAVTGQPGVRISNPGSAFTSTPLMGRSFDIMAGYPNQTCRLTSTTGACGGNNDQFKLTSVAVAPVPLPASMPLLAAGLGLLGWMSRRKA